MEDYAKYARIWQRVDPAVEPYPDAAAVESAPPISRELLREELRHMQALLQLFENALA